MERVLKRQSSCWPQSGAGQRRFVIIDWLAAVLMNMPSTQQEDANRCTNCPGNGSTGKQPPPVAMPFKQKYINRKRYHRYDHHRHSSPDLAGEWNAWNDDEQ